MQVIDAKFKGNKARYVLQCMLATFCVFVVLLVLDAVTNAAVIAALGASSFIAFTMPDAQISRPRFLIGGYIVGVTVGCFCHYLSLVSFLSHLVIIKDCSCVVFGAFAVGLAIFLMVITGTEHPPAASVALGFVLNECDYLLVAMVVLAGIISLSIIKTLLRPALINLV